MPQLVPRVVAAGVHHSIFIDSDNTVWISGDNLKGQLGLKGVGRTTSPEKLNVMNKKVIHSVCAGAFHSLFLDADGCVWACGNDDCGQLGVDESLDREQPQKIQNIPKIRSISASAFSTFLLSEEGTVWSCGHNNTQGLALERKETKFFGNLPKIELVACGVHHCVFVDHEAALWTFGYNYYGQLGFGDTVCRYNPEKLIHFQRKIQFASAGAYFTLVLDEDGNVWACGTNEFGQLGSNSFEDCCNFQQIHGIPLVRYLATGFHHSLFLDFDGIVRSCGYNNCGQLGLGDTEQRNTPETVEIDIGIDFICAGGTHSIVVDTSGGIWTCGNNNFSQLGFTNGELSQHVFRKVNNFITHCNSTHRNTNTKSARNVLIY